VVANINGAPVRIRDIGFAEDGTKEQRSIARLNGVPTVTLEIRRQTGTNTVEVIEAAKANLARIAGQLPPMSRWKLFATNRVHLCRMHEITLHLVLGVFWVAVVLAFMRSWRSTIIAAIAIPASTIATFGMMRALNFTLNSVTMLALC